VKVSRFDKTGVYNIETKPWAAKSLREVLGLEYMRARLECFCVAATPSSVTRRRLLGLCMLHSTPIVQSHQYYDFEPLFPSAPRGSAQEAVHVY
jgi:hypothetical protein